TFITIVGSGFTTPLYLNKVTIAGVAAKIHSAPTVDVSTRMDVEVPILDTFDLARPSQVPLVVENASGGRASMTISVTKHQRTDSGSLMLHYTGMTDATGKALGPGDVLTPGTYHVLYDVACASSNALTITFEMPFHFDNAEWSVSPSHPFSMPLNVTNHM